MASSAIQRQPDAELPVRHPAVDRESISDFVRQFYSKVRRDRRLGPIFAREIGSDWEPHLEKMTNFWCAVILKSRSYDGRPVPAHLKLTDVRESDFAVWLDLFAKTAHQVYPDDVAETFILRAERIARSLQLAMFFRLSTTDETASGRTRNSSTLSAGSD